MQERHSYEEVPYWEFMPDGWPGGERAAFAAVVRSEILQDGRVGEGTRFLIDYSNIIDELCRAFDIKPCESISEMEDEFCRKYYVSARVGEFLEPQELMRIGQIHRDLFAVSQAIDRGAISSERMGCTELHDSFAHLLLKYGGGRVPTHVQKFYHDYCMRPKYCDSWGDHRCIRKAIEENPNFKFSDF